MFLLRVFSAETIHVSMVVKLVLSTSMIETIAGSWVILVGITRTPDVSILMTSITILTRGTD
jgi:hypothetical protein